MSPRGPEGALISRILARHGSRPDLRLWRNEVGVFFAGRIVAELADGCIVLSGKARVSGGLCKGSADLIGIHGDGGRFIALEVKTGKVRLASEQKRYLDLITSMGGIAAVVRSVDDVDDVLGEPT